jgi:hypothetical protein
VAVSQQLAKQDKLYDKQKQDYTKPWRLPLQPYSKTGQTESGWLT